MSESINLDVKSLFKSKKKGVKAFKIGAPVEKPTAQVDMDVHVLDIPEADVVAAPSLKVKETDSAATEDKKTTSWGTVPVEAAPEPVVEVAKPTRYMAFAQSSSQA